MSITARCEEGAMEGSAVPSYCMSARKSSGRLEGSASEAISPICGR
jgi:hypothetical protein